MSHFCPVYPKPRQHKASIWSLFRSARVSWMESLYERSYRMEMGEVHFPGHRLYMVNDPAVVRQVMNDASGSFPKSELLADALRPLLGDSIFTTNGAQWQRQRHMMDPAFGQTKLDVAFPAMLAATQDMLQRLGRLADECAQLDIEVEMTHVTADIIFRTIFSEPITGEAAQRIFAAFARFQSIAPKLLLPTLYGIKWLVWPWDVWRSRKAAAEIRSLLASLVRPRYEAQQKGEDSGKDDILAAFMTARDLATGEPFGFDELVDQVGMLFLAGHETSASALTWSAHLLANAPDVQRRMYDESLAVLGARDPKQSEMKSLEFTRNVFREALRLFPPVGFMARESTQSCPMRDKTVPAGSSIVVSPWLIQRHRSRWSEPDAFNPDRYDNDASREALRTAYLPFGMGPRVCMGAAFALQEATLILACLARDFRLEPVAGHVPRPVGRLTIRSANGMKVKLFRR